MKRLLLVSAFLMVVAAPAALGAEDKISDKTRSCLNCHRGFTPGIVADWETSRHSRTTPAEGMEKPPLERRISAKSVDDSRLNTVVGCYECHGLNTKDHKDNFSHFGHSINVVVSIKDCSTCHPIEAEQYARSKKAHAVGNLQDNPLYHMLYNSIISPKTIKDGKIVMGEPSDYTRQEACFACHGTVIKVDGMKTVQTKLGKLQFPNLINWPNQGVGRINPDGSMGACTACHPRHGFSIEVARKPHTCAQCHLEPDVPAWNVYAASKHGNIYLSEGHKWEYNTVPWVLGRDFTAPTCATCHASLITSPMGDVIAERTHDFGANLWVRLFGLIYTHPQPKHGDTTIIRNADGQPLPTTFEGKPASEFLIDKAEQDKRKNKMMAICKACHSTDWTERHFAKMDNTIKETDAMTRSATVLMQSAWAQGLADPKNPFDEPLEKLWIKQWLFYANTARYASAMTGAQDYVAFKYGWWGLTTNLEKMQEKIELKKALKELQKKMKELQKK